jgi:MFS family permease
MLCKPLQYLAHFLLLLTVAANAIGILMVDRLGRRPLLLSGAAAGLAVSIIALCCRMILQDNSAQQTVYIALHITSLVALGWAWPGWVCLATEHFNLSVRSAGLAITSSIGGIVQGVVYAFAINVVCHLKWGVVLIKAVCSLCILVSGCMQ